VLTKIIFTEVFLMPSFSDRLKELRMSKGLKQQDMADLLEITSRHYQQYEYGKVDLPTSKTQALADFFNVSIDYLLGRTDFKELIEWEAGDEAYLRDEELLKMIEEIQANNIEENKKLKKLIKEFQIVAKKRSTENASKIN